MAKVIFLKADVGVFHRQDCTLLWKGFIKNHNGMEQGLGNSNLRAKFSPPPVFVKEVLFQHSYTSSFPMVSGCFSTTRQN